MKKKILMFVATMFALTVVLTGCATNQVTTATAVRDETKVESQSQEQDFTEIGETFAVTDDWSELEELTAEVISTRQDGALPYEAHGVYTLSGQSYKTYIFNAPNDFYEVVMMNNDESFAFIIHNTGERGVSFQSIIYNDGAFKGLTSNYVLFEEADGTVKAVSIKEKEDCQIGEYQFDVLNFEDLPEKEKNTAIYPTGSYQATF